MYSPYDYRVGRNFPGVLPLRRLQLNMFPLAQEMDLLIDIKLAPRGLRLSQWGLLWKFHRICYLLPLSFAGVLHVGGGRCSRCYLVYYCLPEKLQAINFP